MQSQFHLDTYKTDRDVFINSQTKRERETLFYNIEVNNNVIITDSHTYLQLIMYNVIKITTCLSINEYVGRFTTVNWCAIVVVIFHYWNVSYNPI